MIDKGSEDYKKLVEDISDNFKMLDYERKKINELQEQTKLIRRISNNVLFFAWLLIISISLYIIFMLRAYSLVNEFF